MAPVLDEQSRRRFAALESTGPRARRCQLDGSDNRTGAPGGINEDVLKHPFNEELSELSE
jgi:hypothetical protein